MIGDLILTTNHFSSPLCFMLLLFTSSSPPLLHLDNRPHNHVHHRHNHGLRLFWLRLPPAPSPPYPIPISITITTTTTTTNFTLMTFWPQVISTTSSSSSRVRLRPGRLLRVDHWHNQLPHAQSPRRHSRRWNPPSTVKIQPNYQISLSTITPKRWKWSQSQCTPRCLAEIIMMLSSFKFHVCATKFYLCLQLFLPPWPNSIWQ